MKQLDKQLKYDGFLFCIDFDNTMVGNINNTLKGLGIPSITNKDGLIVNGDLGSMKKNANYDAAQVQKETENLFRFPRFALKNPEQFLYLIKDLLDEGCHVVITSFSKYPESITFALEKLELTEDEIKKIDIICGYPPKGPSDPEGKWVHIQKAMDINNITDPGHVILLDDSGSNIRAAIEHRVNAILFKPYSSEQSLNEVLEKIGELSKDEIILLKQEMLPIEDSIIGKALEEIEDTSEKGGSRVSSKSSSFDNKLSSTSSSFNDVENEGKPIPSEVIGEVEEVTKESGL